MKRLGLDDRVQRYYHSSGNCFRSKRWETKNQDQKLFPGIYCCSYILTKKVEDVITNLPSVVSFVGTDPKAVPLQKHEVERIIGRVEERKNIETIETNFEVGDPDQSYRRAVY